MKRSRFLYLVLAGLLAALLSACGDAAPVTPTPAAVETSAQGRILTADQGSQSVSVIDVASDRLVATVKTGAEPHHVIASPDGTRFWVTHYKENYLLAFDAQTLAEVGRVDVGGGNDDLAFAPDGKRLYVSMGSGDAVAVVDAENMKLLNKISVGKLPHGVRVTPDGKEVYVTNTSENSLSVIKTEGDGMLDLTFRVGANPFEVTFSPDGKLAYVSNFLGASVSVIDTATRKITGTIRVGKQPAMIAFVPGQGKEMIYVANTGSTEVWVIDPHTNQVVNKIPTGGGTHGVVPALGGKVYVSNTTDNTVSVIDEASGKVTATIGVGTNPNGIAYLPPGKAQ